MEEYPDAHPEFLISLEMGMTVDVPLPKVHSCAPDAGPR